LASMCARRVLPQAEARTAESRLAGWAGSDGAAVRAHPVEVPLPGDRAGVLVAAAAAA